MHAWYGMLDLKPFEKLRIIGGIRIEDNEQNVLTSLLAVEWRVEGYPDHH
ncbi:MAG: hypothetical protein WDO16_24285 [Bacteroidota bacterium]